MSDMRRSPLHLEHVRLGAKLVPFGGWEMPVAYPGGTVAEHLACRRDAVMFDVSHLGTVRVEGVVALDSLQGVLTNDLAKIQPGRAQYTHLLDPVDASVVDDIIVWWIAPDVFDVMPNATNTAGVQQAIGGVDTTATRAIIAVQGPEAKHRLAEVVPAAATIGKFRVVTGEWHDVAVTIAGTGYTGESGVEIAVPVDSAGELWRAIEAAGVMPAGLGARDTLRLEAGLPLHGHELGAGITSLQAGLDWVVAWNKPTFRGREALAAERTRGVARLLRGIATDGRRPPRADCAVLVDGESVGVVTSGNFSPVLEHGIALAFLPPSVSDGADVVIDVRGSSLPGRVVPLPFVAKH
jgi:aminomethyltransferase